MQSDLYDILQVAPHAEPEVIEAAYKRLARKYHPDLNESEDAHERMRALNHAYEVLSDPVQRARYDRTHSPKKGGGRTARRAAKPKPKAAPKKRKPEPKWSPPPKPKKETVQEAVSVSDALLAQAQQLSHKHAVISSELLQKELNLKFPRALNLFATLLERGLIDEMGKWTVPAHNATR